MPQLPRKAGRLLGATLLCFESLLGSLRGALKSACAHLRRGATLLFQDVALKLLLSHSLAAAPKGSGLYGSRTYILLGQITLAANVSKGLVDGSVIKLGHKGCCGSWVKSLCCASKRANTLLRSSKPKSARAHKTLLRKIRRRTCAIGSLLQTGLAHLRYPCSARRCLPQITFQGGLQSPRPRSGVTSNTQSALPSPRQPGLPGCCRSGQTSACLTSQLAEAARRPHKFFGRAACCGVRGL